MDKESKILTGLSANEVLQSRAAHGANVLTPPKRTPLWKLYLEKYRDPIIQVLLIAAAISLVLAFVEQDFVETIGIFIAIFLATTIGFYFEVDAARKFNVLTAMNEDLPVKVRREGRVTTIARKDVVVGDIILVEVGDEIPADARLVSAVNLQVDESTLTGEPLTTKRPTEQHAEGERLISAPDPTANNLKEQQNKDGAAYPADVLLRSAMVMNGHGTAVVTAVGDATEIGKVATKSTERTDTKTPLNIQLDKLAGLITKVGTAVSVAAFVIFLVHDILTNSIWHTEDYFGMAQIVLNYFMMAVTLIVMAVPEGLPMAVTLALALNMRRMLKSNNLVRKLHASETMGAVTVICTDKTGTLTQNRMTVSELLTADEALATEETEGNGTAQDKLATEETEKNGKADEGLQPDAQWLLNVAISVNTTANLDGNRPIGNPTEGALLLWLQEKNVDFIELRDRYQVIDQMPFSTEKKYMTTTIDTDDGPVTFMKGAPEIVLAQCALSDDERQKVEKLLLGYQQHAMRTLAFAWRRDDALGLGMSSTASNSYTFQAIAAISDPVREDVPAAVKTCQDAGIQVKVVTGDTSATAAEIARQIGILNDVTVGEESSKFKVQSSKSEITGAEFAALSDEEAYERAEDIRVMSRARPTDKQRLVEMLQKRGEVVAVTGDGTNDAPALNYAHVGLSLGSGTSVAKQASDITLLDDSFHSIANAVMWGRSLYKNIQRFLFFQLVVNLSALLLVLGGSLIGTEMPLTVTQILWVNLIMDTFTAMALATLPPSREVMQDKPRKQTAFIISRPIQRGILFWGGLFFVLMFVFLIWCERHGAGSVVDVHELTLFFTTFVMLQFWNLFNAKCLGSRHSAFHHFWRDRGLILVLVLIFVGQWLIVTFGGKMFRTMPLSWQEWLIISAATSVVLWMGEAWRILSKHPRRGGC